MKEQSKDSGEGRDVRVEAIGVVIGISTQGAGGPLREEVADVWSGALTVSGVPEATVDVSADAEQSRAMESLSTQVTLAALKRQAGHLLTFHAAGIALEDGRVVAFVGPSGRGKTTLSRMLGRMYGYVSDETVAVGADCVVHPYRKPLSVVQPGRPKRQVSPAAAGLQDLPDRPLTLAALVLLNRVDEHQPVVIEPVPLIEGMLGLLPEMSYMSSFEDPLVRLATLCEQVGGVKRLTYSDISQLDGVVEKLVAPGSGTEQWQRVHQMLVPPADYEIGEVLDAIQSGDEILVISHTVIRVISGIAPTIWSAIREGKGLDAVLEDVVVTYGEPEQGDAETLVQDGINSLVGAGLLRKIVPRE